MAKKQTAFDRVTAKVRDLYVEKHGTADGMMSWLAKGTGIWKQALSRAKDSGHLPDGYLEKISKFTGISIVELLRSDVADEVNDLSRKWRATVQDTETALIRLGLDQVNRK